MMIQRWGIALSLLLAMTGACFAADAPAPDPTLAARIAKLEGDVVSAQTAGDNAWMLASAALVLFMTAPGLVLFYGGLVRRKNVLGTMMQSFAMMIFVTLLWAVVGYSLVFAPGNGFIGGLNYLFLHGVGAAPNADYGATVPHQTYMIYQLMFAIITPALITGAFAERTKFGATVVFLLLWTLVVYIPMAHMVWGHGGFLSATLGGTVRALDFAGGSVVHITAGVSALVCAVYLGKRVGYGKQAMPPHNLVYALIGAGMLWVGWFGFNAGSAVAAGSLATSAFVATHFGAAAGAIGWLLAERIKTGRPTTLGGISGAVAGLATITPASGFVAPFPALVIGFTAGIVCFLMVATVKGKLGYDDSLDAFGVHGIGGTIGMLLCGVFASNAVNAIYGPGKPVGMIDGNPGQVGNQLVAIAIAVVLSVVGSYACLKIVDKTIGLRLSKEHEGHGLDLSQHGEEAYQA